MKVAQPTIVAEYTGGVKKVIQQKYFQTKAPIL